MIYSEIYNHKVCDALGLRSWLKRKAAQQGAAIGEIITTGVETVAAGGTAAAGVGVVIGAETLSFINDPFLGGAMDEDMLDQTAEFGRTTAAAATVKALEPVTDLVDVVDGGGTSDDNFYTTVGALVAAPPNSEAARLAEDNVGLYQDDVDYFSFQIKDTASAVSDPVEAGLGRAAEEAESQDKDEVAEWLRVGEEFMNEHGESVVAAVTLGYTTPKIILAAAARGGLKAGFWTLLLGAITIGRMTSALYNALKSAGLLIAGATDPEEDPVQQDESPDEDETKDSDIVQEPEPEMVKEPEEEIKALPIPFDDASLPADTRYRKLEKVY